VAERYRVYAMENLGLSKAEMEVRLERALSLFNLHEHKSSNPLQLSWGWQKLLLLAVVDAIRPRLLLLILRNPAIKECRLLLHKMWQLLPVIVGIFMVQLLFLRTGKVLLSWRWLMVTSTGLSIAATVSLRLLIIIILGAYLTNLSLRDYLAVFRLLHLPETLGVMTAMTLRFIPLLAGEIARSRLILRLRGIQITTLPLSERLSIFQKLILPILGRTLTGVRYQAIGLDGRGFRNGRKHSAFYRQHIVWLDVLVWLGAICLLVIICVSAQR